MIILRDLHFTYPSGTQLFFPDIHIPKGDHYLLLGNSGSGKTTLLHLMGALLRGYSGSLQVLNTELASLTESALDKFRGSHMGFIFQRHHLIKALTVEENILLSPFLGGCATDQNRVEEVLVQLGIYEKRNSKVTTLSEGQAQRVSIARAVVNKPAILLADEPTSALDDKNCENVSELLERVAKESQSTLVLATHDQRLKSLYKNHIQLSDAVIPVS